MAFCIITVAASVLLREPNVPRACELPPQIRALLLNIVPVSFYLWVRVFRQLVILYHYYIFLCTASCLCVLVYFFWVRVFFLRVIIIKPGIAGSSLFSKRARITVYREGLNIVPVYFSLYDVLSVYVCFSVQFPGACFSLRRVLWRR